MTRRSLVLAGALLVTAVLTPAAAQARTPFPATIPLPAGSQPEGITSGPGTTYYAGARLDGAITTGDLRTGTSHTLVPGRDGRVAVGMRYDDATGRLWVAGGFTGAVTVYDASSGTELARYAVSGLHFLNDVEVTPTAVYVTDSLDDALVVVPLGPGSALPAAATTLRLRGDFVETPGFNANGIRALPGGALVVNQSSTGALFRVDPATGVADRIEVTGPTLTSGDGLELRGSTLYDVYGLNRNGIAVVHLGADARTAVVTGELTNVDLDRPTTTTLVADELWTVNGRFDTVPAPTATTPYAVVRVDPQG